MWLSPKNLPFAGFTGAWRPVPEVASGLKVYRFPLGPPLTMTASTPMFEVKSKVWLASSTTIVTVRIPSLNVPSATGSILTAGQLGLPGTSVCGLAELMGPTMATTSAAAIASAAAAAIVVAIRRPEKRDARLVERSIPSPVCCPGPPLAGPAVSGSVGGARGPLQGSHPTASESPGRRALGPIALIGRNRRD